MGRDTFSATPWTEANMNNYQSPRDPLKSRPGTAAGLTDMSPMDETIATNGHYDSVLARNDVQENGYGSPPDNQRSAIVSRDTRHCQYEHNIHRERPKTFETPVGLDYLPKGNGSRMESDARHCEDWKIKDPSHMGAKDCNKTGNSEVTKIVPLKPQRSKKSLSKENKAIVNPQSQFDKGIVGVTGDVHMTKSQDGSYEAGRRVDDNTVLQSATDVVKENTGATRGAMSYQQQTHNQHIKELFGQQELRDCRGTTGQSQWTRGGMLHEDHFQNSKLPTAPPRTLPLKTQWSRDRQSNMDNSHIHYKTPSQETAKRKQAVNHLPPPP